MAPIRAMLAALIAISVAISPAIAEAVVPPSPSSAEVMMVDQADMPCCPCCNAQDDFKSAACAFKCVILAGAILPAMTITLRYLADGSLPSFVDDTLHGLIRPPPTHPPPV
jgi:hypothetical protein